MKPDTDIQLLKGNYYRIFALPDSRFESSMSETKATRHHQITQNVGSGYALSNILKAEPDIDRTLLTFVDRLDSLSRANKSVNFDEWFTYLAFDNLGEITFSKDFGFVENGYDIGNSIANNKKLLLYIAVMGHFWWAHDYLLANPIIGYLNLSPHLHIFETCLAAIQRRMTNDPVRRDMMEQWMDTLKKHPDRMTEKELVAAAAVNIGAGGDTVSCELQACLFKIIKNQAVLEKLRREIDAANLSDIPSYEETKKLPFLQACIKETLRFNPSVGFNLPRISPAGGVTALGRHFPEGVILSVNPWVINRRPEIFGADADIWNPERWMDPERSARMDKYLASFGAGYMMCPGRHMAHMELSKTMALLVKEFDVRLVDEGCEWKFTCHFVVVPFGWPCVVKRREKRRV